MNIGICFGGYCPLHRGHLDLIMESKKKNNLNYVVVCGYDGDSRGQEIGLPLIKRYRIIKNFLEDELVKVIYINDTELGIDQSMSPSNWNRWTEAIARKAKFAYGNSFTFYVAEPFYKESLEKHSFIPCKVELRDRSINPVSGTQCRENPLKYYD